MARCRNLDPDSSNSHKHYLLSNRNRSCTKVKYLCEHLKILIYTTKLVVAVNTERG